MGRKLVLTGTKLASSTAPRLAEVDVLEAKGSLILIDPTHPAGSWGTGVPANGATVKNLLAKNASILTGAAESALQNTFNVSASFTGTAGRAERTTKGGLHVISPQSGTAIAGTAANIAFPPAVLSYILAHPNNDYYMSAWMRQTRATLDGASASSFIAVNGSGQQTNSYLAVMGFRSSGTAYVQRPASDFPIAHLGSTRTAAANELVPSFNAIGTKGWYTNGTPSALPGDGTNNNVTGPYAMGGVAFGSTTQSIGIGTTGVTGSGNLNAGSTSSQKDLQPSAIMYRAYIEDLTVSGRTYAEAEAIDRALYTREVLTAGGRYYGDTFTNPNTIP